MKGTYHWPGKWGCLYKFRGKYRVHLILALQKKSDGLGKLFSIRLFSIYIYVVSHKNTLKIEIWLSFTLHLHMLFSCRLIYFAPLLQRPQVSTGKGALLGVVMRELWCHEARQISRTSLRVQPEDETLNSRAWDFRKATQDSVGRICTHHFQEPSITSLPPNDNSCPFL